MSLTQPFGKLRAFFWPIYQFELKKIIPMFALFFLFSFNYVLLKDTKEPLLVTAPGSGAEAIPFLKIWGVLPLALLFMFLYAKLSNHFRKQTLFYLIIAIYISFFALFGFVLYPFRDFFHPAGFADQLQALLPKGFSGPIAIFRNWTFALFYSFSEVWGSVGISLLFWGFSNDITRVSESKRFYSLFGLGSSVAMFCAGQMMIQFSKVRQVLGAAVDAWGATLKHIVLLVIVCNVLIAAIYWWMNRYVLTDKRFYDNADQPAIAKTKKKTSLKEAFFYLARSKYLLYIALLVIGYSTTVNMIELIWKSQLKLLFPNPNDYSAFRGYFSSVTAVVSLCMMLFVGSNMIRRLGWKISALFTPIMFLITGTAFFTFVIFRESLAPLFSSLNATPVVLAVAVGAIQLCLVKSSKAGLFEPTKEMAYIPLSDEEKTKGKAAVDVVVQKFSKAGVGLVIQGFIFACGTLSGAFPYIGVTFMLILIAWIAGVRGLSKLFHKRTEEAERAAG